MGWTGCYREKGFSDKDFFQKEFGQNFYVLDSARNGMTVFLKVYDREQNTTLAYVVLTRLGRNGGTFGAGSGNLINFYYKEMTENMGPDETRCPLRIIDGLSEPENNDASVWRERVLAFNNKPKAMPGCTIKFKNPFCFKSGLQADTFKMVKEQRKTFFVIPGNEYSRYCLQGWQTADYEVMSV